MCCIVKHSMCREDPGQNPLSLDLKLCCPVYCTCKHISVWNIRPQVQKGKLAHFNGLDLRWNSFKQKYASQWQEASAYLRFHM